MEHISNNLGKSSNFFSCNRTTFNNLWEKCTRKNHSQIYDNMKLNHVALDISGSKFTQPTSMILWVQAFSSLNTRIPIGRSAAATASNSKSKQEIKGRDTSCQYREWELTCDTIPWKHDDISQALQQLPQQQFLWLHGVENHTICS